MHPHLTHFRSSGASGHSGSGGGCHSAWRPAGLQRRLGGVLSPAGSVLRHGQPSGDGCSTTSPSGTPPIRIRPPHPLHTQFFAAVTAFLRQGLQGSSDCSNFARTHTLNQNDFLPKQVFSFFLFWEAESTVSAVNMQCIFYVFLLHRASNVKWT